MEKSGGKMAGSVKQEEIHDLLFNREIGWQEIIYDLINTEQLDPWHVDIIILTEKYLEKVSELEEADFFVSSKVLLAASLLLRIKSEILLKEHIKSIDEILFGRKEEKKTALERIELDEDIPGLLPRSPLPRFKKVTLQELMEALSKAISTENRRIKKELLDRNTLRQLRAGGVGVPGKKVKIKHRIRNVYSELLDYFRKNEAVKKVSYTDFTGVKKEERIVAFQPLLHLEHQKKIWLDQNAHFGEIFIWLKHIYLKHNPEPFAELKRELEEDVKQLDEERAKKVDEEFPNPLGGL